MYYLGIAYVCVISIILINTIYKGRAYRACKVIKDVEREKKKLFVKRYLVQKKIEVTDHKTQKVNDIVFGWLKEVDKLVQEFENVTLIAEQESMRYHNEMLNKLKALNTKCEFETFSNQIPSLDHFSSGNFVCFESIKDSSDRLLEALQNCNFYKIGLYGKRGSGKTKLVKAVAEKARYLGVFDAVLFFTVSYNPNVKWIQDEIADLLHLKFDNKNTEVGRAREIYLTLERMDGPVLVILDDVWENLDLEELGIPCNNNRCKVLLTAHSKQKLALMNCQEEIPLGPLSIEESWTLFKNHSGIDNESSTDLLNVASEVAIECQGLPRTIKDLGSSLRSKPIEEWKASLESLRYAMTQCDIFISFRGKDTRDSFTGFLYDALCREGFKTFMDDDELKGGDEISSLIKAIEASRISIVVFSEKFAHSTWCLDELVTILKCKKMNNQQILPIFYKIEQSDVRHQKNSYERGMAKQVKRFGDDFEKLQKWRSALFEVASLSGITYKTGYEYKLVHTIVERVNSQI